MGQIDGPGCFEAAKQKARFGHRDWVFWRDARGPHAAPKSVESLKTALLAAGTKGNWSLLSADTGSPSRGFWWLGINMIAQTKRGWA